MDSTQVVRTILHLGLLGALSLFLGACSGVSIYTDPRMAKETETGVPFYMPKPYLLLTRTNKKDEPISVQVIYLPDTENPRYARHRRGLGSTTVTLKLSNGVLTEFGQTTDSKVPETITAAAGGLKSVAEALKIQRERELLEAQSASIEELNQDGATIKSVGMQIVGNVDEYRALTSNEAADEFEKIGKAIEFGGSKLAGPDAEAFLNESLKTIGELVVKLGKAKLTSTSAPASTINEKIDAWSSTLNEILKKFEEKPAAPPIIELYEIKQDHGVTTLVLVPMPN